MNVCILWIGSWLLYGTSPSEHPLKHPMFLPWKLAPTKLDVFRRTCHWPETTSSITYYLTSKNPKKSQEIVLPREAPKCRQGTLEAPGPPWDVESTSSQISPWPRSNPPKRCQTTKGVSICSFFRRFEMFWRLQWFKIILLGWTYYHQLTLSH